jgi:hypothetical protein
MITTARKLPVLPSGKETSSAKARFATHTGVNSHTAKSTAERSYGDDVANLDSLFEPDAVVSAQYFDNFQRKTPTEPENRLLMAVLEDAIHCFQDNVLAENGKSKKLFDDAEEWVLKERSDWIFSFRNVCELLGIDPEYLRAGLIRWKQQHYHSCKTDKVNSVKIRHQGNGKV